MRQVNRIFDDFPDVEIILGAVKDQHGQRRNWIWTTHGWNHFFSTAVIVRDNKWNITTAFELYRIMMEYQPHIMISNELMAVVHDPFADPLTPDQATELLKFLELPPKFQSLYPNIVPYFPTHRICIIGDYAHQCQYFANAFEALGWKVSRLATDLDRESIPHQIDHVFDQEGLYEKKGFLEGRSMVRMWAKIRRYNPDYILVVQNGLELNFKGVDEPIYYYAHEGALPMFPHECKIQGFFYAYYGAPPQYLNAHRYHMQQTKFRQLIPYAWDPEQYPTGTKKRNIFFGFMGAVGSTPDPMEMTSMDYITLHIRDLRNKIVPFAQRRCDLIVRPKGTEEEYIKFMHHTSLALNVSANFGFTTQRQFHAMGLGCVLVQNYYKGLEELGFKDRINCLIYQNEYELEDVIIWAKKHPDEIEAIRQAGIMLAKKNTYMNRAQKMMEKILQYE